MSVNYNVEDMEDLSVNIKDVTIHISDKPCSTCTRPLDMIDCERFCDSYHNWLKTI